jgi:hypothetical protein
MKTVAAIIEQVNAEKREETKPNPRPKRHFVAPTIPAIRGIDSIEKYLGRYQAAFERSTTGAILDMIRDKAFTSKPCTRCDGSGILGTIEEAMLGGNLTEKQSGRPIMDALAEKFADCPECHGSGAICRPRGKGSVALSKDAPFAPLNALDARPGAGGEHRAKEPPPDDVLIEYAKTSRRLMYMLPSLREAFCEACGPEGQSWADDKRGRVWAVLKCTEAGRRLLRDDPGLSPDKRIGQRLTEIADHQERALTPDKGKGKQIQEAIHEASVLLTAAINAWNATFGDGE